MAPFRHLLDDHRLWSIRRRNVVPAFSLGLFIAFLPFPGHMLIGILLAMALRINVAVAALSTLVVNPLTMGPVFYATHELGIWLLGIESQPFEFELSLGWIIGQVDDVFGPMLLGGIIAGTIAAILGYVALDLLWRASIADYLAKRRAKRKA